MAFKRDAVSRMDVKAAGRKVECLGRKVFDFLADRIFLAAVAPSSFHAISFSKGKLLPERFRGKSGAVASKLSSKYKLRRSSIFEQVFRVRKFPESSNRTVHFTHLNIRVRN